MFLGICIFVTLLFLILFIVGIFSGDNDLCFCCGISLFLIILFGWGLFGTAMDVKTKYYIVKSYSNSIELPDKSFIIFYIDREGNHKEQRFDKLSDLVIKDNKEFILSVGINMYGKECRKEFIISDVPPNIVIENKTVEK